MSDFGADETDIRDEMPASPRPSSHPRRRSKAGRQDSGIESPRIDSPRMTLMVDRVHVTTAASQDTVNIVRNIALLLTHSAFFKHFAIKRSYDIRVK